MINPRLMIFFTSLAKKHGTKVLHGNNVELLVQDLGAALREQKNIISDPRKNALLTAYDVIPVIVEVKILTGIIARKLDIATDSRPIISVLEDIVAAMDARDKPRYANGIRETLDWTRRLFSHPDIQGLMEMEVATLETPKSLGDLTRFFFTAAGRAQSELARVNEFLKHAKILEDAPEAPQAAQPSAAAEEKPAPKAVEEKKPAAKSPRKPRTPRKPKPE